MNRIDELIKKLCPNGVEYRPIWSLTAWDKKFNGVDKEKQKKVISYKYYLSTDFTKVEKKNGNIKYISTGISGDDRYTTEELAGDYIADGEVVCIPWGGTPNVKYHKGKFVTGDNRIATSLDVNILSNKFLYYWMQSKINVISKFYRGSGIKHPSMKDVLDMNIAVPPMEVQYEIVNILDEFTRTSAGLLANLGAELETRKKQFEFYRNKLFEEVKEKSEILKIQDISKNISSGGTPLTSVSEYYNGEIPWLRTQEVDFDEIWDTEIKITDLALNNSSAKMIPANCVIVAMYGATVGKSGINKIPLTTNQACCNIEVDETKVDYKYLFYWLSERYEYIKSLGQGSQTNINSKIVKELEVPVPSLNEQKRVIEILDKYTKNTKDILESITCEINLRKQQYEYYRDQLLSFRKVEI